MKIEELIDRLIEIQNKYNVSLNVSLMQEGEFLISNSNKYGFQEIDKVPIQLESRIKDIAVSTNKQGNLDRIILIGKELE